MCCHFLYITTVLSEKVTSHRGFSFHSHVPCSHHESSLELSAHCSAGSFDLLPLACRSPSAQISSCSQMNLISLGRLLFHSVDYCLATQKLWVSYNPTCECLLQLPTLTMKTLPMLMPEGISRQLLVETAQFGGLHLHPLSIWVFFFKYQRKVLFFA